MAQQLSTSAGNSNESRRRYARSKLHYCRTRNKTTVLDRLRKTGNYRRCFRTTSDRCRWREWAGETSPRRIESAVKAGAGQNRCQATEPTCLMRGSSVLSMERVFIRERSSSCRPATAMADAGATARVRAHLAEHGHWRSARRHVEPNAPARPLLPARPTRETACLERELLELRHYALYSVLISSANYT